MAFVRHIFLWQAMLGVLTVGLTFLLAREVLPPQFAIAVTALTSLSPHLATITAEVLTESLFTTALVAATLALVRAFQTQRRSWAIAGGLLWGIASLVRPTAELFLPLVFAATLLVPQLRTYRGQALTLLIAFAVVMAPWFVRNSLTELRPTNANLTINFLHHGSYPDFKYQGRDETLGFPYRFDPNSARIGRSIPDALAGIVANFREDPLTQSRWYLIGKPISFLSWNIVGGRGDIFTAEPVRSPFLNERMFASLRDFMYLLHWPLMVLGLAGAAISVWGPAWLRLSGPALLAARLVSGLLAYAIALHMVGAPFPRYGIPFRPLMYLLAVVPVWGLVNSERIRRKAHV